MSRPQPDDGPRRTDQQREQQWRLSSGADVDEALHAAERLLAAAKDRHRHAQNTTFAIWSGVAGAMLSFAASLYFLPLLLDSRGLATVGAWASLAVTASIVLVLLRELWGQRRRASFDHSLMLAHHIASMINEAVNDVADREGWSYLRLQTIKLRLSAFPLSDSPAEHFRRAR
ncbi:hypothetical protein AB0M43_39120 [Longispora sp. NPDC051575]|uniref:hypothetical protein n=1 Tax=Longispora sp. NPDC051575 TaxID=3154943 RepID=UPI00342EB73A